MITENSNGRNVADAINAIDPSGGGLVKLRVGTYNIGHFCLGTGSSSGVTSGTLQTWLDNYHSALNTAGLDILCATEYEPNIVSGNAAKDSVFNNFVFNAIGAKKAYNCNAIFSNIAIGQPTTVDFVDRAQDRYYIYTTIHVGGKDVKVISTHLDFNDQSKRQSQINQVINAFANDDYVIWCGDFNVFNGYEADWQLIRNAGYTMANMGYAGEFITAPYVPPGSDTLVNYKLDNICVKGFAISEVKTFGTLEMSDHYALQAVLLML